MKAIAVAVKEFRQVGRDRRTLMILLFVPAFFLLLYGYALNFDIRNIPLAVQDNDPQQHEPRRHLPRSSIRGTSTLSRTCRVTRMSSAFLTAATRAPCLSFQEGSPVTRGAVGRPACSC